MPERQRRRKWYKPRSLIIITFSPFHPSFSFLTQEFVSFVAITFKPFIAFIFQHKFSLFTLIAELLTANFVSNFRRSILEVRSTWKNKPKVLLISCVSKILTNKAPLNKEFLSFNFLFFSSFLMFRERKALLRWI